MTPPVLAIAIVVLLHVVCLPILVVGVARRWCDKQVILFWAPLAAASLVYAIVIFSGMPPLQTLGFTALAFVCSSLTSVYLKRMQALL